TCYRTRQARAPTSPVFEPWPTPRTHWQVLLSPGPNTAGDRVVNVCVPSLMVPVNERPSKSKVEHFVLLNPFWYQSFSLTFRIYSGGHWPPSGGFGGSSIPLKSGGN